MGVPSVSRSCFIDALQVDRLVGQHVAWLLSVNKYSINILIFEKFFDYCENDKFLEPLC